MEIFLEITTLIGVFILQFNLHVASEMSVCWTVRFGANQSSTKHYVQILE